MREEAMHLRDDARRRFRSAWDQAAGEPPSETGPEDRESAESGGPRHGHDWGRWGDWGRWSDWGRWGDWGGRGNWPGPKDTAAFRDLERLARDFAMDLRKVAWDSGALGSDVLGDLRNILEDTLDRIRTEVFGSAAEEPKPAEPASSASPEAEHPASPEPPTD
jgi:hypothetical protein